MIGPAPTHDGGVDSAANLVDPSPWARRVRSVTIVDAAFALMLLATLVTYFRWNRHVVINSDDWLLAPRGNSFADYFRPYEDNFSLVTIGVYHAFFSLFGFGTYWPLRLFGIASHLAVASVVYVSFRARLRSQAAFLAGVVILWYPGTLLIPSLFNHWLALAACAVCAWAIPRPGRAYDLVVGLALTFALCTSAVGVAGAVACVVFVLVTRCPSRRRMAVALPVVLFALWWVTLGRSGHAAATGPSRSFSEGVRFVFDGALYSFQLTATDSHWLGTVLAIAFVGLLVVRLRRGLSAAAQQLAWTAALITWWAGLAYSRAFFGPSTFRYRLVGCTFLLLAVVPLRPSPRVRRAVSGTAATVAVAALTAVVIWVNASGIHALAQRDVANYQRIQQKFIALERGPDVVPDERIVRFDIFTVLSARQYRDLVAKYGSPAGSHPAHPDAKIVALGHIAPVTVPGSDSPCGAEARDLQVAPTIDRQNGINPVTELVLRAGDRDATVQIRRFEDSWTSIGRIRAGTTAKIDLPVLMTGTPWFVRASGACRVSGG